jgi:hypothetical protein
MAIKEWMRIADDKILQLETRTREIHLKQLEFLLGQKIENQTQDDSQDNKKFRLDRFLLSLRRLGESLRKATKARDYVASVWVDCLDYVLP